MKKFIIYILIAIFISTSMGSVMTYAENTGAATVITPIPDIPILPKPPNQDRDTLVSSVLPNYGVILISFVGVTTLIFLLIGGVRFATAYGNEESIEKAKNQIKYALAGFILALLSYTIVIIVNNLFIEAPTETATTEEVSQ